MAKSVGWSSSVWYASTAKEWCAILGPPWRFLSPLLGPPILFLSPWPPNREEGVFSPRLGPPITEQFLSPWPPNREEGVFSPRPPRRELVFSPRPCPPCRELLIPWGVFCMRGEVFSSVLCRRGLFRWARVEEERPSPDVENGNVILISDNKNNNQYF